MSQGDFTDIDQAVLTYHRIAEAFKFAYARRSDLGDEDFLDIEDVSFIIHDTLCSNNFFC